MTVRLVAKLACLSRVFTLCFVWLANVSMSDGRNGLVLGVQRDPLAWGSKLLNSLVQWDGAHFLNIAVRGYDSVLSHAFMPGLPMVMRLASFVVKTDSAYWMAIWGLIFVQVSFVFAAIGLYKLSCYLQTSMNINPMRATLFYIFCSANIFQSALYTESPFCMCTFWGIYWLVSDRFWRATLAFSVAMMFRSNGILALGYVLFASPKTRNAYTRIVAAACIYLPYYLYTQWSTNEFCPGAIWCGKRSIYAHVQKTFWKVDFLSYWTLNNIWFFLLMLPALTVALHAPYFYLRDLINKKDKEHALLYMCFLGQMGILTAFVVFVANSQILTRILTSCPMYFWTFDRLTKQKGLGEYVFFLNFAYFLAGPIFFGNGLNWT